MRYLKVSKIKFMYDQLMVKICNWCIQFLKDMAISTGLSYEEINVWLSLTDNKNTGFFILDYDDSIDYFKKYSNDELTNLALNDKEGYNQDCHKLADEVDSTIEYVFLFIMIMQRKSCQR